MQYLNIQPYLRGRFRSQYAYGAWMLRRMIRRTIRPVGYLIAGLSCLSPATGSIPVSYLVATRMLPPLPDMRTIKDEPLVKTPMGLWNSIVLRS